MSSRRLILLALALSLAIHLGVLGSGLLPEVQLELPPDQDLRSISVKMQALDADEPAAKPEPQGAVAQLRPATPSRRRPSQAHRQEGGGIGAAGGVGGHPRPGAAKQGQQRAAGEAKREASAPDADIKIASSAPVADEMAANDKDEASAPAAETAADDGYIHPKGALRGAAPGHTGLPSVLGLGHGRHRHAGMEPRQRRLPPGHQRHPFIGPKLRYLSEGGFQLKTGCGRTACKPGVASKPKSPRISTTMRVSCATAIRATNCWS